MTAAASVLVVSDTHLASARGLPAPVLELADRADHVIHAGDVVDPDVLDVLEALAPVTAVVGNVDGFAVAERLPERATVRLGGVEVGVVHVPGPAAGRHERLRGWFPTASVIVYGHTHEPELVTTPDGVLVVNPGSPTQRRRAPTHTVAWIELADGRVADAQVVHLD